MNEASTDVKSIKKAMEIGVSTGEIATGEYILMNYRGQMSPALEEFIEKVVAKAYKDLEEEFETPAEDIALKVGTLFNK